MLFGIDRLTRRISFGMGVAGRGARRSPVIDKIAAEFESQLKLAQNAANLLGTVGSGNPDCGLVPEAARSKVVGLGLSVFVLSTIAFVDLTFLSMVEAIGKSWTFWAYAIITSLGVMFVPETKGHDLSTLSTTGGTAAVGPAPTPRAARNRRPPPECRLRALSLAAHAQPPAGRTRAAGIEPGY